MTAVTCEITNQVGGYATIYLTQGRPLQPRCGSSPDRQAYGLAVEQEGMSLPVTCTQIALGDLVPNHLVLRSTKGGNGLTKGALYHPLAVNHKGEIAVSPITDIQALVQGARGMWHHMLGFEWQSNEAARVPTDNDN